jgi:predicted metal-dependent peptidase
MSDNVDKEARRLQKAHITLMRNPKFALYSGILMVGKVSVRDDIPTACTNGRDVLYGRKFIQMLNDKELAFVVLHEAMHKAYRHLTVWRKLYNENPGLANAACDYVINLELYNFDPEGNVIAMPKVGGLLDPKYAGMNSKQVFDLLKQEQKSGGGGKGQGQGGGSGHGGFDEHDWESAKEMTAEERKALERDIDAALRQGQMAVKKAGKGAGNLSRELQDLMEPKVDWRDALREFVKSTCANKDASSWRRVNRRYIGNDVYMPTLIGEAMGRIVIGVDTSGSIGGEELAEFLSEVKSIADAVAPEQVDLLYWDSRVAAHETYNRSELTGLTQATKPAGGGGTSPSCVTEYLKEHSIVPECSVMLTDGYVGNDWGDGWPSPVLWCVVRNPSAEAPNGRTIHID